MAPYSNSIRNITLKDFAKKKFDPLALLGSFFREYVPLRIVPERSRRGEDLKRDAGIATVANETENVNPNTFQSLE